MTRSYHKVRFSDRHAEMLEVAGYFTAVGDGCQNGHVAFAVLTFGHIDPKDFSQHFAPAGVFKGNAVCAGFFGDLPFFSSGFRTTFFR